MVAIARSRRRIMQIPVLVDEDGTARILVNEHGIIRKVTSREIVLDKLAIELSRTARCLLCNRIIYIGDESIYYISEICYEDEDSNSSMALYGEIFTIFNGSRIMRDLLSTASRELTILLATGQIADRWAILYRMGSSYVKLYGDYAIGSRIRRMILLSDNALAVEYNNDVLTILVLDDLCEILKRREIILDGRRILLP
ncbi:MAG: hypothetical protein GXO26_09055 [Crenarchaeota archaeon]|nr:hypothetical protein [Thermoproteota archaeon]